MTLQSVEVQADCISFSKELINLLQSLPYQTCTVHNCDPLKECDCNQTCFKPTVYSSEQTPFITLCGQ